MIDPRSSQHDRRRDGAPRTDIPTMTEAIRHLRRLVLIQRPYWPWFAQSFVLTVIVGAVGLATPYTTKLLVDEAYPARDVQLAYVLLGGVLAFTVATSVMGAVSSYFSQAYTGRLSSAADLMFFNHVQHLPMQFFDSRPVGEIMSRSGDLRSSLGTVAVLFQTLLTGGVNLLILPPVLLYLNWQLTVLSVIVLPVTVGVGLLSSRWVRRYQKLNAEARADLSAFQFEALTNMRSLKALALEATTFERVQTHAGVILETQLRAARVQIGSTLVNGLSRALGALVFSAYAWHLILNDQLTVGSFFAFSAYLGYMRGPLSSVVNLVVNLQQAAVSLSRMFEYLDSPVEQDPRGVVCAPSVIAHKIAGDLVLREVSVRYERGPNILTDVSLTCIRGQLSVIVGSSGAGKTTLLRLVPRLLEPSSGQILIGGHDVRSIPLKTLRQQIAFASQDSVVLRGTLRENLLLGTTGIAESRIEEALDSCSLLQFARSLPDWLDTPVAEWGATLSGGQRQRIALVRALLRDAPVLLLDEATSNVDITAEDGILAALIKHRSERVTVLVSHRPAVAAQADWICSLSHGRVDEVGSPSNVWQKVALLRNSGTTPTHFDGRCDLSVSP